MAKVKQSVITVRMDPALHAGLKELSQRSRMSINQITLDVLRLAVTDDKESFAVMCTAMEKQRRHERAERLKKAAMAGEEI